MDVGGRNPRRGSVNIRIISGKCFDVFSSQSKGGGSGSMERTMGGVGFIWVEISDSGTLYIPFSINGKYEKVTYRYV